MPWQVLCAAQSSMVPNADLSIEAAELARADAKVIPGLCTSEAEIGALGARADGLLTLGVGLGRRRNRAWHPGGQHLFLPRGRGQPHHTVAARLRAQADAAPPGAERGPLAA